MYAAAISLSVVTTAGTAGFPFFQLGSLNIGIPIQAFGVIVAAGVLIGASLLRRYAEWHGVSDDHIRGLTGWITITGFLGAHWFDVLAYEPQKLSEPMGSWPPSQWPVLIRLWDGISSYGGFIGGAMGFIIYVWWKRLPARLMADIAIVGLLPAFSIGRIGCTVVSDHIGAWVDPDKWYAMFAMEYPRTLNMTVVQGLVAEHPGTSEYIKAWNLGLIELMYLVPVNALILYLAFRSTKRLAAGTVVVVAGMLYAPVRFFLEFLRPVSSDPRYLELTFAQWASLLAFGVCVYATIKMRGGKPAETVTTTSREAQERLRVILKEDDDKADKKDDKKAKPKTEAKQADDKDDKDDKKAKKATDALAKPAAEVPPTEPFIDALPKDIIKKVEEGKKAAEEAKADAAKAKPEAPEGDKSEPAKPAEQAKADEADDGDDEGAEEAGEKAADDKSPAAVVKPGQPGQKKKKKKKK